MHVGLPLVLSRIKSDVVAADRLLGAVLIKLIAQRSRLVRPDEGISLSEPQIADAAALGEQHDRALSLFGECDVADGLAVAAARDVL